MTRGRTLYCFRRLKTFFDKLDFREAQLSDIDMGLHPGNPPLWSWSRTSGDLAQWAEDELLSVVLNLEPRTATPQTLSSEKPFARLQKVPIGEDRHINTLHVPAVKEKPQKRVLVMAHGYGAGLGFFYKNYATLAKIPGLHLYSIDWLGMANSSRPPFPYPKSQLTDKDIVLHAESFFIDALEHWRKASGIDRMTLMGHSLGGYLCTGYALRFPQHVDKLILVSPAGVPEPPPEGGLQRKGALISLFRQLWTWNVTPMSVLRAVGPFGSSLLKSYTSRRFAHLEPKEASAFHDYIYHISAQPGSGEFALNSLLLPGAFARWPLADRVHGLQMPTTFVYGTQDWMDFRGALSVVPSMKVPTRVALVDQAGHHLYLDNPKAFDAALMAEILGGKAPEADGVVYVHDRS